jgi:GAF domain-containing protein
MNQEINSVPTPQSEPSPEPQNLIQRLRQWAVPPVFPGDEERTRQAAVLNSILIGAIVLSFLYGLSLPFTSVNFLPVAGIILAMLGVLSFGLFNIRRGHITATSFFLVIFAWLMAAGTSLMFGGVSGPVFSSFIVITIAAGLVIGFRAALGIASGSIIFGLVLVFLQNAGVIEPFDGTPTSFFFRLAFNIVIITFLIFLTIQNTSDALKSAEDSQKDLLITNEQLRLGQSSLENMIAENQEKIEQRDKYLEAASLITKSTTEVTRLQEMLDQIVSTISRQFGFYHVGLFLVEESGQWAILEAASSAGGRAMIDRYHRLEVGKQGIVGFVTGIGQPRISQDIQLDRIHSVTPELPETRSEMALPLKTRGEIFGALDIQHNEPDAFSEEDISALQTLVDQIAQAVENQRLHEQVQDSLEEMQRVYGDYSQKAWAETRKQKEITAYKFSDGALTPVLNTDTTIEADNKVEIPIVVRGHQIGLVEIAREDPLAEWTDEEQELLLNLSDQLGIALDSARLFNETQLRATTEQIIGNINAEIMESLEINSILRTTVEKIRDTLDLPEVSIKMTAPSSTQPSGNGNSQETDESN